MAKAFDRLAERAKAKDIPRVTARFAEHLESGESVLVAVNGYQAYWPGPRKRCLALATDRNVYMFRVSGLKALPRRMLEKHPVGNVPVSWDHQEMVRWQAQRLAPLKIGESSMWVSVVGVPRILTLELIAHAAGQPLRTEQGGSDRPRPD